jgi:hypothetical protein
MLADGRRSAGCLHLPVDVPEAPKAVRLAQDVELVLLSPMRLVDFRWS